MESGILMRYIIGYGRTDKGNVREINEDNLCINRYFKEKEDDSAEYTFREKRDCLIGVFDGIGGEACGEMASFIAAKTMARFDGHLPKNDWELLLNDMNWRINDFAKQNQPCNLGSTAAIVSVQKNNVQACNLGDSRIYFYRDKSLKKISKDHTELQRALDMNLDNFNLEKSGIKKNGLTRYLGIHASKLSPFVVSDIVLQPNAFLLLCSDGLTDMVSEEKIEEIMSLENCKEIVDNLMEQALIAGGRDNITIIVFTVEEKVSWWKKYFIKNRNEKGESI